MNNQELTKEELIKQNDFLKIRMNKLSERLLGANEYIADLETDLHFAQEAIQHFNNANQEEA